MSAFVKTRDSALNAIKRYMTKSINEASTLDIDSVESYLSLLSEQWTRFNTAQDAVETSCGVDNAEVEENARIQTETWYATALSNFKRIQKYSAEPASQPTYSSATVSASIRLPKMDLPTFAGDPTEWISFYDAFCSLIDCNAALSGGQKLHYLRSCLKGDALRLINGFKISNANYTEAWNLLKSRYKVMRVIVEAHLRAISEIKIAADDTADAIRGVLNAFQQHVRELKALGRPVQFWDDWLVHKIVTKLAFETRKQWELSLVTDEPPTLEQLTTFLEVRSRSLEMLTTPAAQLVGEPITPKVVGKSTQVFHAISEQPNTHCTYCKEAHRIYSCGKFRDLDKTAKSKFVQESKACFNCLSPRHYKDRCNSASACRICHQRHHTLLHDMVASNSSTAPAHFIAEANHSVPNTPFSRVYTTAPPNPMSPATMSPSNTAATSVSSCLSSGSNPLPATQKTVLLSTALVRVRDCADRWQTARVLFDSGSHATFVTEACVQRLGIPRLLSSVIVTGIGSSQSGRCRGETSLLISSRFSDARYPVDALILPEITSDLPSQALDIPEWPHIRGLVLADPHFMEPGRVDILVGMDVMCSLICPELRKGPPGTPMAQKTVFGWTLCGSVDSPPTRKVQSLHCEVQFDRAPMRLGELEQYPLKPHLTHEDRFTSMHRRTSSDRFLAELPLKVDGPWDGPRDFAVRSLICTARKIGRNNGFQSRYSEIMQELPQVDHKDALVVRFRKHHNGVTANIVKMFRQICVSPKQVSLYHNVCHPHLSSSIQHYRKLHVTYGVAAAFPLAAITLKPTAKESDVAHYAIAMLFKNCPMLSLKISYIQYFTVHAIHCIMQVVFQDRLWMIGALSLILSIYYKCFKCPCRNRSAFTNSTSEFPTSRACLRYVTRPPVDLTDRYFYKFAHGRRAKSAKGEIFSFICFGLGAPNLEVVGDLSTPAFPNELKRFINRRGFCDTMFCDNVPVVGYEKELRFMVGECMADDALQSFSQTST